MAEPKTINPKKIDARERIIIATSELLSERDTLDISISEISARAELNHGLVQYYFGGKEGLLLTLLKRDSDRALARTAALVRKDMPPLEKLEQHIRSAINDYYSRPYINRLITFLQNSSISNAEYLSRIFIKPLVAYQAQLLLEASQNGDIGHVDPMYFYYSVLGCCEFLFQSKKTLPCAFGIEGITHDLKEGYADFLVHMILRGLHTPKSASRRV